MSDAAQKVLLVGASVRAMAQSVIRGGDVPICIDLFGDADLRAIAETHVLPRHDYPDGFIEVAKAFPGIPRLYSGGLENHPDVVDALAESGPLWGCDAAVLRRVRDPLRLAELSDPPFLAAPAAAQNAANVPTDGSWLCKPIRGSAGRGIRPWSGGELRDDEYLQRRVAGEPHSAAFIGGDVGVSLIGVSRQLVGCDWCNAPPFAYCGSIGPIEDPDSTASALIRLGNRIAAKFGVRGWFGVDFLLDGGVVHPVEINPRYTASMELYERAGVADLYPLHRAVVGQRAFSSRVAPLRRCVGKAVVFADRRLELMHPLRGVPDPQTSDIPFPGAVFDPGDPIITVVATALDVDGVESRLRERSAEIRARLPLR